MVTDFTYRTLGPVLVAAWILGPFAAKGAEPVAAGSAQGASIQEKDAAEPEAMQRKVSFEFVETPLEEALAFLTSLSQKQFVFDAVDENFKQVALSLRVADMEMAIAIRWLARLSGAKLAYSGSTIKFVKK